MFLLLKRSHDGSRRDDEPARRREFVEGSTTGKRRVAETDESVTRTLCSCARFVDQFCRATCIFGRSVQAIL